LEMEWVEKKGAEKSLGRGRGCVFGSSPKWLEQPHLNLRSQPPTLMERGVPCWGERKGVAIMCKNTNTMGVSGPWFFMAKLWNIV
jgi:hypothetical protein